MVQERLAVVEATGLEPTTSWSLTKRATKLRYASISRYFRALALYSLDIISLIQYKVKRF